MLKNRLKVYLGGYQDQLDKSRKEELTNSLLYLSNLSKNINLNEELSPSKVKCKVGELDTQKLLNDSLKLLQFGSQQFTNQTDG